MAFQIVRALSAPTLAGRENGPLRVLLIGAAVLTVMLSWTVVNTAYTLRCAHLHFASPAPLGQRRFSDRGGCGRRGACHGLQPQPPGSPR